MSSPAPDSGTERAWALLREVVGDLNHDDYVPTAAAVKGELLRRDPAFDERALGFRRFVDFLTEAAERGAIGMVRDNRNHPRVFPAGVPVEKISAAIDVPALLVRGDRRLRREVWRTFVNWQPENYWRGWDRGANRVFMAPQLDGDAAPWVDDASRFVEIPVIAGEQQFEWMREFAAAQPPPERDALLNALAPAAPSGSFKKVLTELNLAEHWSDTLRVKVSRYVGEWAQANHVRVMSLVERPSREQGVPETGRTTWTSERADKQPVAPRPASEVATEHLRRELHAVIDKMNYAELAAISVPAAFLLDR